MTEGRRKRSIFIEWKAEDLTGGTGTGTGTGTGVGSNVLYVVEERHYTGRHYMESRMNEWSTCFRTAKRSQILRHFVKPGRWYQFRVAAVNENGTKGFSEPSIRFSISSGKSKTKSYSLRYTLVYLHL